MKNVTVYADPKYFAGWPANHGAWQWGNEFLVGFMRGRYAPEKLRTHRIKEPFEKLQARSLDGGETWTVEQPNVDFEGIDPINPPKFDPFKVNIRFCGFYDHGGDHCPHGAFYTTQNRGKTWQGPYRLKGVQGILGERCSTRTARLGRDSFLMTWRHADNEDDIVWLIDYDNGRFIPRSIVAGNDRPALMPQGVNIDGRLVVAVRRMAPDYGIEAFVSDDDGNNWRFLSRIGETGRHNGNPPAIITDGYSIWCSYANRDKGRIMLAVSNDGGETWHEEVIRKAPKGGKSDIGYPQMFLRLDGRLVCVYYWSEPKGPPQHIEATII